MAEFRRNLSTVFLLGIGLMAGAVAAQPQDSVSFRFRALGWQSTEMPDLYYRTREGEDRKIEMPQRFRSPEYSYSGSPDIVFYQIKTEGESSQVRVPVCQFTSDGTTTDWLFLFVHDEATGTVRVFGMDDSMTSFPFGGCRFFNLTERTLGIVYGREKLKLNPKSYETATPGVDPRQNVQLQILAIRNEQLQDIYNSQWPQETNARYLIFIIESERRRERVEVESVAEYLRDH